MKYMKKTVLFWPWLVRDTIYMEQERLRHFHMLRGTSGVRTIHLSHLYLPEIDDANMMYPQRVETEQLWPLKIP